MTEREIARNAVGLDVVNPRVERAAGSEIEAGIVAMARQQAALDGSTMQRKARVRAPIVERKCRTFAPKDTDRLSASLPGETACLLQLVQRPNCDAIAHGDLSNNALRPPR